MAKRKLSKLQIAYSEFFFSMLEEFDVPSPAKLSKEKKSEFFNRIKKEWPAAKRKVQQEGILTAVEKKRIIEEVIIRNMIREELSR